MVFSDSQYYVIIKVIEVRVLYFLHGDDKYSLTAKVNSLSTTNGQNIDIEDFLLEESNLIDLIHSEATGSLFFDYKLIKITDSKIFSTKISDETYDLLES